MRIFKFWNENGDEKETEQLSLKKAIMSVQGNFKDKMIKIVIVTRPPICLTGSGNTFILFKYSCIIIIIIILAIYRFSKFLFFAFHRTK